ncbi:MAG: 50S ribosomal protein L21 [Spiroplasma ixodetis]|nr:50S ribosomal protein L21 [Spiroplasma ixodetis]MBP1528526.1 50S ribosomal protein L21 [Spiroplasma ixodetis]
MFVVIQTGGKQINVSYGQEIFVEKLVGKAKDKIIFDKILMIDQQFGKPFLKGAEVHGEIIKQDKSKKIRVFKYKPKKNSKTMYGHRQPYTKVLITDILLAGKSLVDKKAEQSKQVIKDEVKKEVISKVVTPIIKESKSVVSKVKKELTKEKVVKTKSVVKDNITEPDNTKTVVSEGNLKTIFDHKNMTVKVVKEDDENNKK